jgi:hypothetical protein
MSIVKNTQKKYTFQNQVKRKAILDLNTLGNENKNLFKFRYETIGCYIEFMITRI